MNDVQQYKAYIDYPCQWQFRLIGEDMIAMQAALGKYVDLNTVCLARGNASSGGKYHSLLVEMQVRSEEERLHWYSILAAEPAVRMVL